jgi:Rieske Fe-S protein
MGINRKKFLDILLGIGSLGGLTAIVYPALSFLKPPESAEPKVNFLKVGMASEFPSNSSKIVKFGRTPVILIKGPENNFNAFAATCTHLDCLVQYRNETNQIWCACHNGVYDMNGRNVSGPPPKPLEEFIVSVVNDEIIIKSKAG